MKNWIKSVLYIPKHSKPADENIMRLLLPSFVGILICMVCLAGATWAWFSASVTSAGNTIAAADYAVTVQSVLNGTDKVEPDANGNYTLDQDKTYTITLQAKGNAQKWGGYCLIENEGKTVKLYTQTFKPDEHITIEFTPPVDGIYTFTGIWGGIPNSVGEDDIIRAETAPVPKAPESQQPADNGETVYVVQKGDSLWKISQQYEGISDDEIAAYNGIDKKEVLQIGQEIKIPPADYEIPEPPVSSSTEQKAEEAAPNESTDTESELTSPIADPTEKPTGATEDSSGVTDPAVRE